VTIKRHSQAGFEGFRARGRSPSRDLQTLSLVQMLVGKAFPSSQNFDPDELCFRRSRTILPAVPPPRRDARF
jgi:hypothetical protein